MESGADKIAYGARMQYITDWTDDPRKVKANYSLRPPSHFMTRQQAATMRRIAKIEKKRREKAKDISDPKAYLHAKKEEQNHEVMAKALAGMMNIEEWKNSVTKKGSRETYLETRMQETRAAMPRSSKQKVAEWEQIYEAGCMFWKNTLTGECTTENPFGVTAETKRVVSPVVRRLKRADEAGTDAGCGAKVYSSQEFDEFMAMLDDHASPKRRAQPKKAWGVEFISDPMM